MTISRTLYIFKFLVKFSDVHYFCIKCKYHISKILLRIATKRERITPQILLTTKKRYLPWKPYCFPLNLLGTSCQGAATIYSSGHHCSLLKFSLEICFQKHIQVPLSTCLLSHGLFQPCIHQERVLLLSPLLLLLKYC